jgi:hypothetical protein
MRRYPIRSTQTRLTPCSARAVTCSGAEKSILFQKKNPFSEIKINCTQESSRDVSRSVAEEPLHSLGKMTRLIQFKS